MSSGNWHDIDTESFTLAAARVEPIYHDNAGTLDETCRYIEKAGDEGTDLVVFPEMYFPGYPYWRGSVSIPRWTDLMVDLRKNSLRVDDAIEVLGDAVADAGVPSDWIRTNSATAAAATRCTTPSSTSTGMALSSVDTGS